jgi:hypothetical protein
MTQRIYIHISKLRYVPNAWVFYITHKELSNIGIDPKTLSTEDVITIFGITRSIEFHYTSTSNGMFFRPHEPGDSRYLLAIKE